MPARSTDRPGRARCRAGLPRATWRPPRACTGATQRLAPVVDRLPHRVGVDRHDDRARDLVVPRLLLRIPEHPEVAEEDDDRREEPADVAQDPAAVADWAARLEVDHADAESPLADRLTGR